MKKLLKFCGFILSVCLCACMFVACDETNSGGTGGSGDAGSGSKPAVTRTWKEILASDDMKNVSVTIKSAMQQGDESHEATMEYHRDGNKYKCTSQFVEYGSTTPQSITEYFEHDGDKWYIYHTAPDNVTMKTELDEDGRYEFTYGTGSSSSELSYAFVYVTMVEGFNAKIIAEESKFDKGTESNGAKVYKLEGDMMSIYMAMSGVSEAAPEGYTMTGKVEITVKADKITEITFNADLAVNGTPMNSSQVIYEYAYGNTSVTLPALTEAQV